MAPPSALAISLVNTFQDVMTAGIGIDAFKNSKQ
jgi:hypothetical protein